MKNAASPQREQTVEGFHLALGPTDIDGIAHKVADQILPIVHSRDQSLTLNVTPHLPEISADSLRIEQILLHLLSNAVKFTPDGGSISLSASSNGNFIVIEIRDSGPSILSEEQHQVFQPCYRLKDENEKDAPGLGLGLALCKHLVELHGGTMWVKSEQGEGKSIAFALPLKKLASA
jgi:signal transduction histidine kinase